MKHDSESVEQPTPEQLMAYADGELDEGVARRVADWLETDPDAVREIEHQRHLARVWQETATPPPGDEAWDQVKAGIRDALAHSAPPKAGSPLWKYVGAAAAVLLAVTLFTYWPRPIERAESLATGLPAWLVAEGDEEFPVATSGEIEVISMNPDDSGALAVGQPLELDEIDLVTHDEITIVDKADPDINVEEWGTPMIVDPTVVVVNSVP